jgi:hypothetical protein
MIMPYGKRPTGVAAKVGPSKVDFDALWNSVYKPVIEKLGYQPVRADQDLGAVIIKDMIERLTISDLCLADITIANANVYYEIGVRHAAAPKGCVLVSADWTKPAFDLAQIRHVSFPLRSTAPDAAEAKTLRAHLRQAIDPHRQAPSPIFELLPGYPPAKMKGATSFQTLVSDISKFHGKIAAATSSANDNDRKAAVRKLARTFLAQKSFVSSVALEVLAVVRDHADFDDVRAYIAELPQDLQESPYVQEQLALAASKTGDHHEAIAALESLIQLRGETSERRGLLGGRYKKLYLDALKKNRRDDGAHYLDLAIENYTTGMYLDLNDYYSPSNLPRLLRTRNAQGDEQLAVTAAEVTRAGCERKLQSDPNDPWLGQTLLGQAVDAADVVTARRLVDTIRKKRYPQWHVDTTAADLQMSLKLVRNATLRTQLVRALAPLRRTTK